VILSTRGCKGAIESNFKCDIYLLGPRVSICYSCLYIILSSQIYKIFNSSVLVNDLFILFVESCCISTVLTVHYLIIHIIHKV